MALDYKFSLFGLDRTTEKYTEVKSKVPTDLWIVVFHHSKRYSRNPVQRSQENTLITWDLGLAHWSISPELGFPRASIVIILAFQIIMWGSGTLYKHWRPNREFDIFVPAELEVFMGHAFHAPLLAYWIDIMCSISPFCISPWFAPDRTHLLQSITCWPSTLGLVPPS